MRGLHDQEPVGGVVAARLRAVRPHLAAVILFGPLLGAGVAFGRPDFEASAATVAAALVLGGAGTAYFRSRWLRPRRWPSAAAALGVLSGILVGTAFPALIWLTAPLAAAVLGAAGWRIADLARGHVLEPYTRDLADSGVEVPWRARGTGGLELLVGSDRITLAGSRGRFRTVRPMVALSGVGAVEQVMVARRATLPVPGVGELRVTVTPGPAVRITVPPGEWIVPTDDGREIARLVARRKELAGID
ncbi:hypothetical protein [Actinokineospora sp.]|uniref:hypothetical protein n=1 Tax=Actinokineospora sp. TaxID=1872133 RepID=UPI0040377A86